MIVEFHDRDGRVVHNDFKDWCIANEGGFFFAFKSKAKANLRVSGGCHHNGGGLWRYDGVTSITSARKVCSANSQDLLMWAQTEGIEWKWCKHCADSLPEPMQCRRGGRRSLTQHR